MAMFAAVFARSRGFVCATVIAVMTCMAVGCSVVLTSTLGSVDGEAAPMKPDFDTAFASLTPEPLSANRVIEQDFEIFEIAARPQRGNTPSRREKLRNAGWRRIL